MRRALLAAGLLVGGLVLAAGPVAAEATSQVAVTGTWTATGALGGAACPAAGQVRHVFDGDADLEPLGAATFRVDYCFATGVPYPASGAGTFSLATAEGTMAGTVAARIQNEGTPTSVRYDLAVTRGTGRFCGATGDLTLFGQFTALGVSGSGTVSGELILAASPK